MSQLVGLASVHSGAPLPNGVQDEGATNLIKA